MKNSITMMALAAMLLSACSKEEGTTAAGDRTVRINPTIANPALTPSAKSTRATDTDFELGDRVGLRITMNADGSQFVDNKLMSFDGTDFKSDGFLWYEDVNATSTMLAYYPFAEGATVPTEFAVLADQGGDNYKASDLIVAVKAGVKPTLSSTAMTFRHKMARIVIRVTNESGSDVTGIVVKGAVGTGVLDPGTGDFTAKEGAEKVDVTANKASASVYYALLVPQSGVQLQVTVATADGKKRTQTLGVTDLKSGENRGMECNVQPADIEVKYTGAIAGWEDGDELLPDGEGTIEIPTVEWGGVKYKIVTLKDGRTWMAENLRYVPEGKTPSSDPSDGNGVWYPCNLEKAADPALVETNGLLYSYPMLLGISGEFTADNFDKKEGVQGICPDGWHVPTMAEWLKLAGTGSGSLSDPTSPYFDAAESGAPIPKLNADGLNIAGYGYINAASSVAAPAYAATKSAVDQSAYGMGYFASSTAYKLTYNTADDTTSGIKNIQYYAGMLTYNAKNNRLTVAYQGAYGAAPVRCIKNAE
ncbi:fimbrillin family protein [Alistipes sp.]|uniref:fimbrillin family protein n=1 Tax=Alistipes sp. TaxID=1872444 RepID=UPI003AEF243B